MRLMGAGGERYWKCGHFVIFAGEGFTSGRSAMVCRMERHYAHIAVNRKTILESIKKERTKPNDVS